MSTYRKKEQVILGYGLLIIDLCSVILSYLGAMYLRFHSLKPLEESNIHIITLFSLLMFCMIYHFVVDSNRGFVSRGYFVEMLVLLKRDMIILVVWGCIVFLLQFGHEFSRLVVAYFIILNILFTYVLHLCYKKYVRVYYATKRKKIKVMLITNSEQVGNILPTFRREVEYLYELDSMIIWDQNWQGKEIAEIPIVANADNMVDITKQMALDEVFIYLPNEKRETIRNIIMEFETMGVVCHYSIDVTDINAKTRVLEEFAGFTVITYALNPIDYQHRMIKRCMDIAGGLCGLLITAVLFPFIAIAIKLDSKGPVLFSQVRIGKNGHRFKMYKFRSMVVDAEEQKKALLKYNEMQGLMFKMEQDPRVTKVGRFLRKTSLDELPQFYNVLKGDMSLVGTRPPTEDEFEKYDSYYKRRLSMHPGLTGLWQISGRSDISDFDDVVKYDLKYIDYWSLSLDIKIILQTIVVVFCGRGAK